MKKQNDKQRSQRKGVSRRDFIKSTATAGTLTIAGLAGLEAAGAKTERAVVDATGSHDTARDQVRPRENRQAILFNLGDTLIPSSPNDPGYRDLEWYGITDEVNRRLEELADEDLGLFNQSAVDLLHKPFVDLSASERSDYLNRLFQPGSVRDPVLQDKLKDIVKRAREAVFTVYYQNFPEDHCAHDARRVPLLRPGDEHEITNPGTAGLVTGWDVTGYAGPLTWEEEERRRKYFKKIRWEE